MVATATDVLRASALALGAVACSFAAASSEDVVDPARIPYYDNVNEQARSELASYFAAKSPKALAINADGGLYWWGAVASTTEASRRALEDCELFQKSPCVLGAVDNVIQKPNTGASAGSAFAGLGNELEPDKVPFLSDAARKKLASVYRQERKNGLQYMALALHPRNGWYLKVDPSFKSQEDADAAALSDCAKAVPPNRYWKRSSCLLFAEGSRVVANLPHAVRFVSAATVQAAETGQAAQGMSQSADRANASVPVSPSGQTASAGSGPFPVLAKAPEVHFIHMGGNDCPPCVIWRATELPKLQALAEFRHVRFSFVTKTIQSAVPPRLFLPDEVKAYKEILDVANAGTPGSPQAAVIVDGKIFDYYWGVRSAEEIEAMLKSIRTGSKYPFARCLQMAPDSRRCGIHA